MEQLNLYLYEEDLKRKTMKEAGMEKIAKESRETYEYLKKETRKMEGPFPRARE